MSGVILISPSFLRASPVLVPLGPPTQLSPDPVTNPDPVVANLVAVMDNYFQLPYYPGGTPDYLSQIYLFSNMYNATSFAVDPCNDSIIHCQIGQNNLVHLTNTFWIP